ncbi:hypothetical protein [Magnetospirillum moscoviense]|uniref:Uncharacterized protein n=1 Tax=Magnetospirillum moscoviense TaxID=1437059 RepID=A0A178MZ40_9PROT|nr:hypothetical protein [Magnetospirillum moscoviense]OAN55124.1 hypothetical protein A6A05_00760 [Magnetospirillum moscoviense]
MTSYFHTTSKRLAKRVWEALGGTIRHIRQTGEVRYDHGVLPPLVQFPDILLRFGRGFRLANGHHQLNEDSRIIQHGKQLFDRIDKRGRRDDALVTLGIAKETIDRISDRCPRAERHADQNCIVNIIVATFGAGHLKGLKPPNGQLEFFP